MDEWLTHLPAAGLIFARCAGMLAVMPPLGAPAHMPGFPVTLRVGLAAALAMALLPAATVAEGLEQPVAGAWVALLLQEAAVGAVAGFAGALVYWGFLIAGQLLDTLLGTGTTPLRAEGRGPIATFVYLLAAALLVAADGHHWLLTALARGMVVLPIGGGWSPEGLPGVADAVGVMLLTGVAIAAPALAAIYAAESVLAGFDRIAPGLGLSDAAPAVRSTSALLGLLVTAPLLGRLVMEQGLRAAQAIEAAFRLLAG